MSNANIIQNARAFVSMCKKIGKLGKGGYGFYIIKDESSYGSTEFYIKHTFHDVDRLLFAQKWLQTGKSDMVEYCYNSILDEVPLTPQEQGFFLQYLSDFCDFLRGGIPNYNQCICDGANDITIIQSLGVCLRSEAASTYMDLNRVVI